MRYFQKIKPTFRDVAAVVLTGIWVNASEFLRNEVLLKHYWTGHYGSLGLVFPSSPLNGMVWVAWGFLFALAIYAISRKFSLIQTVMLSWFVAFVLMWVVLWNLNVLPAAILVYAVPFSLFECLVGAYVCSRVARMV